MFEVNCVVNILFFYLFMWGWNDKEYELNNWFWNVDDYLYIFCFFKSLNLMFWDCFIL